MKNAKPKLEIALFILVDGRRSEGRVVKPMRGKRTDWTIIHEAKGVVSGFVGWLAETKRRKKVETRQRLCPSAMKSTNGKPVSRNGRCFVAPRRPKPATMTRTKLKESNIKTGRVTTWRNKFGEISG